MHAISTPDGRSFEAREDEFLLDAALRQGIALPYSCRTGRCSTCKGRVCSGQTIALTDETGLTAEEIADGFILTCVRQARGNVEIEVDDLGAVRLPPAKTLPCRIQSIERLAHDVIGVVLRLPPTSTFEFIAGQYLDVIGEGGLRRSYSIANAPHANPSIELHIRAVPDGQMSRYWFGQAKINDLLRLRGPHGTFFLREQAQKHLVFLATGTGIAPVKAMIEALSTLPPAEQPARVSVYWGGRHASDLYWQPPALPGLRFVPVLSGADDNWEGARGYVQDVMLRDGPDLANTVVYACGSDAMIHSAHALLRSAGLADRQFRADAFVCSAPT